MPNSPLLGNLYGLGRRVKRRWLRVSDPSPASTEIPWFESVNRDTSSLLEAPWLLPFKRDEKEPRFTGPGADVLSAGLATPPPDPPPRAGLSLWLPRLPPARLAAHGASFKQPPTLSLGLGSHFHLWLTSQEAENMTQRGHVFEGEGPRSPGHRPGRPRLRPRGWPTSPERLVRARHQPGWASGARQGTRGQAPALVECRPQAKGREAGNKPQA